MARRVKNGLAEDGVKIEGLNKAMTRMKKAVGSLDDLQPALQKIADIGVTELRRYTPERTGALKKTIRKSRAKRVARITIGRARPLHYAPFINYGTKQVRAQRFITKAKEAAARPAKRIYEREIATVLKRNLG